MSAQFNNTAYFPHLQMFQVYHLLHLSNANLHLITDVTVLRNGFVLLVLSIMSFAFLQKLINAAALTKDGDNDLQMFDTRNGYTYDVVIKTLTNWTFKGRCLYLLIELIDITVYFYAYKSVFIVLINIMVASVVEAYQFAHIKHVIRNYVYFPVILGRIDLLEDSLQILMTILFDFHDSEYYHTLVAAGSLANIVKWNTVRLGSAVFLILVNLYFYAYCFIKSKKDKDK